MAMAMAMAMAIAMANTPGLRLCICPVFLIDPLPFIGEHRDHVAVPASAIPGIARSAGSGAAGVRRLMIAADPWAVK
jgi:hypothetical protein